MIELSDNLADLLDRIERTSLWGLALPIEDELLWVHHLRDLGFVRIGETGRVTTTRDGHHWLQERARLRASTPTTVPEAERQLGFPEDL